MFPIARVVFASTVSVYSPQHLPIDETIVPRPLNSYGASKIRGEEAVKRHSNAVIVRFSSLYGPGMRTSTFLPILVRQALYDRELRLWGLGQRMQDYLHVRDAAMMLVRAAASPSRGPLLGVYGTSFSNIAIAKMLSGLCGDVPIRFVQAEDSSPSFRYSASASHQIMKFEPQRSHPSAIRSDQGSPFASCLM